jgi:hypothetical protein
MAENLDTPQLGNFSIQDTMDMGMGSQELLNDLFATETATGNPDDIKDIKDEPAPDPAPAPKKTTSKTPAPAPEEGEKKDENPTKDIQSFLYGGDEDEDEEDEDDQPDTGSPVGKKKEPTQSADNQEDSNEEDEDGEGAPVSQFTALSKDLFKLGVFSQEDGEEDTPIDTPEAFLERFQAEKKKGAIEIVDNFIGQFGEDYQKAFDAIFVKGVDPKDYFSTYNQIQSFTDMDLTKESNQVAVIKQALTDQGFEPEDVDTEVERLKNYGDLENVATKHHKVLVKKEAAKLQQMEQQKEAQLQQQQAIKQQYVQNVNTVLQEKIKAKDFDGIPINPKLAGELQDFLVTDKYKTASGETLTDFDRAILELKRPENHANKVKLALIMKILEKDPTLSTIQKTGITKKSNELFGEVARQAQKSSVKSKQTARPTSWFQ